MYLQDCVVHNLCAIYNDFMFKVYNNSQKRKVFLVQEKLPCDLAESLWDKEKKEKVFIDFNN